jgi:hypothetical protein
MLGFLNMLKGYTFFRQPAPVLEWDLLAPQSFQSGRYKVEADYYDGVVSIYFDAHWIKQLLDIEGAKRWCAYDAQKRGLLLARRQAQIGKARGSVNSAPRTSW